MTTNHDAQGCDLTDEELIDHISEATTMSKGVDEYEGARIVDATALYACLPASLHA